MAKKTDVIRVSQGFADALRKQSKETGIPIIDLTEKLGPEVRKKKRMDGDPFALSFGDD